MLINILNGFISLIKGPDTSRLLNVTNVHLHLNI